MLPNNLYLCLLSDYMRHIMQLNQERNWVYHNVRDGQIIVFHSLSLHKVDMFYYLVLVFFLLVVR